MNVQFVNKIPKGFTHIKGMREPLYGYNNEIIGFTDLGNSKVESKIVIVRGKETQLKKYHRQLYEQVQDWLDKQETRTLELTMSRRAWRCLEEFSAKNKLQIEVAMEEAVLALE